VLPVRYELNLYMLCRRSYAASLCSGQSSWLLTQWSVFDSRRLQIFREVVGLERFSPILVSTIEELLGRNNMGSRLEIREYGGGNFLCCSRYTLCPQMFSLTSPTRGGRTDGIVRSRTEATEFIL
jgi:hypothetical protein